MLIKKSQTFNRPLPPRDPDKDGPKPILDPFQSQHMVTKLLELEQSILSDLWGSLEQRTSESAGAQNAAVGFQPCYFSSASRDLHRAIDRYLDEK